MRLAGVLATALVATLATATAARAASPFDGTYKGTTTSSGGNYGCATSRDISVKVADGRFNYAGGGAENRISVEIGKDGSFSGQSGQRYLSGKVANGAMTATTSASNCNYMWSLTKQ